MPASRPTGPTEREAVASRDLILDARAPAGQRHASRKATLQEQKKRTHLGAIDGTGVLMPLAGRAPGGTGRGVVAVNGGLKEERERE